MRERGVPELNFCADGVDGWIEMNGREDKEKEMSDDKSESHVHYHYHVAPGQRLAQEGCVILVQSEDVVAERERCARLVEGVVYRMGDGNRSNKSDLVRHCNELAALIRMPDLTRATRG